jgi:hypothetical protein
VDVTARKVTVRKNIANVITREILATRDADAMDA